MKNKSKYLNKKQISYDKEMVKFLKERGLYEEFKKYKKGKKTS